MKTLAKQRVEARCARKRRFRDHAEAIRSLHNIESRGEARASRPCRTYFCDMCNGWHLTKQASA